MRRAAAAALCVGVWASMSCGAGASKALLNLEHVQTIDDGAVCNDGSPAGYYIDHSTNSDYQGVFLLYLEGGMWCYNNETCTYRYATAPTFMSSAYWPWTLELGGVFDTNPAKSPFAYANKVYAAYCSSDAWVGNTDDKSDATFGFYFRGQRILRAIIGALVQIHQLGQRAGHRLLLAGCSAGGRGALFNLDYVAGILAEFDAAFPVQVQGLFDSPLWMDLKPLYPNVVPLLNQTQMAFSFMNATGRLGEACGEYYFSDPYRCLFGQFRLPFVETPYLLNMAQFDKFQLPYDLGSSMPPYAGPALTYADTFQEEVVSILAGLPTAKQNKSAIFSPACFTHCLSDESTFWGVHIDEISLRDVLQEWFFDGIVVRAEDNCTGFKCGQCRGVAGKEHDGLSRKRITSKAAPGVSVSLVLHTAPSQTEKINTAVASSEEHGVTTGPLGVHTGEAAGQGQGQAKLPTSIVLRNTGELLLMLVCIFFCMIRLVRRDSSRRSTVEDDTESMPLVERRTRMADNVLLLNPRTMGARTMGF